MTCLSLFSWKNGWQIPPFGRNDKTLVLGWNKKGRLRRPFLFPNPIELLSFRAKLGIYIRLVFSSSFCAICYTDRSTKT